VFQHFFDACVMPETVCLVCKYCEQKRDIHAKHCFILADKKNEIDFCLSTFSFSLKHVVLSVVVDNED
jgi:hypothetical protein